MMDFSRMFGNVRTRFITVAVASTFFCSAAWADGGAEDARRAGDLFDKGVQEFSAANYGPATRTFLSADALIPNVRAVLNALSSARQSKDPLLIAAAAERLLAHRDVGPDDAAHAREELGSVTRRLARLELDCSPQPSTVAIDGEAVTPGVAYAIPGAHEVTCEGSGQRARAHVSCEAGALCRVALQLPSPAANASATPASSPSSAAPPRRDVTAEPSTAATKPKPFSPVVFVAGAVVTAGLLGVTIWSGVDAISARGKYTSDPNAYDPDEVHRDARRSNFLLAGTLVCAGATAAIGLWFVDWDSRPRARVSWSPGGGSVAVEGRF